MAKLNPNINYQGELDSLRQIYVQSQPQARYGIIARRINQDEIGPVALCTLGSAVEALARAVVVHRSVSPALDLATSYENERHAKPEALVEKVLTSFGKAAPSDFFAEDTWELFGYAVKFRNLVMHECTYLGQDKFVSLIAATRDVLNALRKVSGLAE